jgi:hypothetical protein
MTYTHARTHTHTHRVGDQMAEIQLTQTPEPVFTAIRLLGSKNVWSTSNKLTYLLTYTKEQSPSWEANRFSASQEIPRVLRNPKVHYRHLSLSWASLIQSTPSYSTSWRSILILSSHLCLDLLSGLFSFRFPHQNPVYASPLPHTRYMPRPSASNKTQQYKTQTTQESLLLIK